MKTSRLFILFAALAAGAFAQSSPPPPSPPIHHDFDFWIGEWEVFGKNGSAAKVGESRVEAISGGYGILENWSALGVYNLGTSISNYEAHSGQWQQYYIGTGGGTTLYKGGMVGDKMVMIAEAFTAKGARYLTRGTWTPNPDGSVRQQFEISTDDGKTWQPSFDGLYKRKPAR